MSKIISYNRTRAVSYAVKHAYQRDLNFFDFTEFGGNCTAYVSQCLFYANKIMNPEKIFGWYYYSSFKRSPSWSGVEFFYNFLINNKTLGPFANLVELHKVELGDVIQLKFDGFESFTHTLIVTKINMQKSPLTPDDVFVSSNTYDVLNKKLSDYDYQNIRVLKIKGFYTY